MVHGWYEEEMMEEGCCLAILRCRVGKDTSFGLPCYAYSTIIPSIATTDTCSARRLPSPPATARSHCDTLPRYPPRPNTSP